MLESILYGPQSRYIRKLEMGIHILGNKSITVRSLPGNHGFQQNRGFGVR